MRELRQKEIEALKLRKDAEKRERTGSGIKRKSETGIWYNARMGDKDAKSEKEERNHKKRRRKREVGLRGRVDEERERERKKGVESWKMEH